jgi:hypothetical protein
MFGTVKKWLGMEGTRVRLHTLSVYPKTVKTINGEIEVYAKQTETIQSIRLRFIEVYTRGKGEDKRIDEYELGIWVHDHPLTLMNGERQLLPFKLAFEPLQSAMDRRAQKAPLLKGVFNLMKNLKGVQSDYRIEAEVIVEGSTWHPMAKAKIVFEE